MKASHQSRSLVSLSASFQEGGTVHANKAKIQTNEQCTDQKLSKMGIAFPKVTLIALKGSYLDVQLDSLEFLDGNFKSLLALLLCQPGTLATWPVLSHIGQLPHRHLLQEWSNND